MALWSVRAFHAAVHPPQRRIRSIVRWLLLQRGTAGLDQCSGRQRGSEKASRHGLPAGASLELVPAPSTSTPCLSLRVSA